MRSRHTAIAAGLLAAVLAVSGCGADASPDSASVLNVGTLTATPSLDPVVASGGNIPYFQPAYDTLIKREPNGDYSPMLATSWKYDAARTNLTLTLRDDVKFDDGAPLDASAVKANLKRFKSGGGGSATQLSTLESVDVVDSSTVVLQLNAADPAMLFNLSDAAGFMANPSAFDDPDTLATEPDGTGPYELDTTATTIGTKYVYNRKPDYWGEKLPFKSMTVSVFENENAIVNGLKTGQLNAALVESADQAEAAKADTTLKVQEWEFNFQGILLLDRAGVVNPALGDVRVRQAINYAIQRDLMVKQIRSGQGEVTAQVWGEDAPGYVADLDDAYTYDPDKARTLLRQAGYGDGLTLKLPRMAAIVNDAMASSLQTDLDAVGITLNWVDVDAGNALRRIVQDKEFGGFVFNVGQSAIDWNTIRTLILPGAMNPFGSTDDTVTSLVPKIQSVDPDKAAPIVQKLNRRIVAEAWFAPFYRMKQAFITGAGIDVEQQSGVGFPSIYNFTQRG